jgi:hypothetical protein
MLATARRAVERVYGRCGALPPNFSERSRAPANRSRGTKIRPGSIDPLKPSINALKQMSFRENSDFADAYDMHLQWRNNGRRPSPKGNDIVRRSIYAEAPFSIYSEWQEVRGTIR